MKRAILFLIPFVFFGCATTNTDKTVQRSNEVVFEKKPVITDFSSVARSGICVGKNSDNCYIEGYRAYEKGEYLKAIYAFNFSCANFQHIPSCVKLASMFEKGQGVEVNLYNAYDLYKRACYSGDNKSCMEKHRLEKTNK